MISFRKLDDHLLYTVREIAANLPISNSLTSVIEEDQLDAATLIGDLDSVVKRLGSDLDRDYREAWPLVDPALHTEFVLEEGFPRDGFLSIMTRLSPGDARNESVSYGARLQRIGIDQYALWSDF